MLSRRNRWSRRHRPVRRLAAATAALLAALSLTVLGPAAPAVAQVTCTPVNGVDVCENEGEIPGGGEEEGGGPAPGGGRTCLYDGEQVPCYDERYGWYEGDGCYLQIAQPQPEIDPPDGAQPGGAWYTRTCPYVSDGADLRRDAVWRNPGEVGPNPEELARRALARIGLRGPVIGLAPDPSGAGLVGLPVYLWTEQYGPGDSYADSESEAGLVVTIQATAVETEWDMGDGTIVYCGTDNPGVPYDPSYGAAPSECGHVYQRPSLDQPGGEYRIVAATRWLVSYSSNISVSGSFPHWTQSETALTVHELQVVTS